MKIKHWLISGFILVLAGLFVPTAQAVDTGFYGGGGMGRSDDDVLNDKDFGWKLFGGFQFSRNLGFEVAFVDLGDFTDLGGNPVSQDGISFQLVGTIPGNRIDLFGKIGIFFWEYDTLFGFNDGEDPTVGFGLNVNSRDRRWAIRGEWERFFDIAGGDVDLLSVSFLFRF